MIMLPVDDDGEAVSCTPMHHLPDVEHAAARRVDEHAPLEAQVIHLRGRHAERRKDDDVAALHVDVAAVRIPRVRQDADAHLLQPVVHVRVMDDFSGQEDAAIGEPMRAPRTHTRPLDRRRNRSRIPGRV